MTAVDGGTPRSGPGKTERQDAARLDRIRHRAALRYAVLATLAAAIVLLPIQRQTLRFQDGDAPTWVDTAVTVGMAGLVIGLGCYLLRLRDLNAPLQLGLSRHERRLVDSAVKRLDPPHDPVLAAAAANRATCELRDITGLRRRRIALGIMLVAAVCSTGVWWVWVLWLLPIAILVMRLQQAPTRARAAASYLGARQDAPRREAVASELFDDLSWTAGHTFAAPMIDVRGTSRATELERELLRELHSRHPLAHRPWRVVAEARVTDDVVAVSGPNVVVVHLTWHEETDPRWPAWEECRTRDDFEELVEDRYRFA